MPFAGCTDGEWRRAEALEKHMNIVLLAPSLEAGGAERQLVVLANALALRGHDVCVALFRARGSLRGLLEPGVSVHDLKKKGRADLVGFLYRLWRLVQREKPDVIYSFLGVPNLSTIFLKALSPALPVVWGVRASDMDLSRYGALSRLCFFAEMALSRFADRIIVNSEAGGEYAASKGVPDDLITVVPNGFDGVLFVPDKAQGAALRRDWGCPDTDVLIGIVARLDPMKDHETFLRAARLAKDRDPDLRFVGVGDGHLRGRLEDLSRQLGLSDDLVWAGAHSDMPAVYNALDILCLSSITEGFPNVLGEAMSCGVPCVATDVGDAAHIVGDTGLVVPKRNPEALAEAMVRMARRVRNGEVPDTRTRIVERFSQERMVLETEKILLEVVR
jgi:glycosyltransferase involved in cell wall biosynthesis